MKRHLHDHGVQVVNLNEELRRGRWHWTAAATMDAQRRQERRRQAASGLETHVEVPVFHQIMSQEPGSIDSCSREMRRICWVHKRYLN